MCQSLDIEPSRQLRSKMLMYQIGAVALGLVAGCATTQQEQPNLLAKAQGAQNPVPQFSGFLGDYTLLQSGGQGQGLYRHLNASVNRSQYTAFMVEPVPFWDGGDSLASLKESTISLRILL